MMKVLIIDTLTNDIVSFEQLSPDFFLFAVFDKINAFLDHMVAVPILLEA